MSELDKILEFNKPNSWSSDEQDAKRKVKKLFLDLFKEADYDPWKFVEKVESL